MLQLFQCSDAATSASASTQHSRTFQPIQARQATCFKASILIQDFNPSCTGMGVKYCIPACPVTTMHWTLERTQASLGSLNYPLTFAAVCYLYTVACPLLQVMSLQCPTMRRATLKGQP